MHMMNYGISAESRAGSLKIFGEITYRDLTLSLRERAKVEAAVLAWILKHPRGCPGDEIQYWVHFSRTPTDGKVHCRVEIFGDVAVWESTESSFEPLSALKSCLDSILPVLASTA